LRKQTIIRVFVSLDHIWYQSPRETGMKMPSVHPKDEGRKINLCARFPRTERPVVEHERGTNFCHQAKVLLVQKGYKGVSATKKFRSLNVGSADRSAVYVDHPRLVWISTP
jgi:hypothetical protein